jgi:hypothetical protein
MKLKYEARKRTRVNYGFYGFCSLEAGWWYNYIVDEWQYEPTGGGYGSHQYCRSVRAFRRLLKKAPKGVKFILVGKWKGRTVEGVGMNPIKSPFQYEQAPVYIHEEKALTVNVVFRSDKEVDRNTMQYEIEIISGGLGYNPTLNHYILRFTERLQPHLWVLAKYIRKSVFYKACAYQCCNDIYFEFSDGTKLAFSWRGWGDFMQAIVGEREGYMMHY